MPNFTFKAFEQILLDICANDMRVRSARIIDEWNANTRTDDDYTIVLYDFTSQDIKLNQRAQQYIEYTVHIAVMDQLLADRTNMADVISHTADVLAGVVAQLRSSSTLRDLGIRFVQPNVQIQQAAIRGDDNIAGCHADIVMQFAPSISGCDVPSLPLDAGANDYDVASPVSLLCSQLVNCGVIQTIQANIDELYTLTGGTGGAATYVQEGDNIYTGGTASLPTVNLSKNISVDSISASTIYSGSTDMSELLGDSITNFFSSVESVEIAGDLIVSGLTVLLGGLALPDIDANPVIWMDKNTHQLSGSSTFSYNSVSDLVQMNQSTTNVAQVNQSLKLDMINPSSVLYLSHHYVTGDTAFDYDPSLSQLRAPAFSASSISATTYYSGSTPLNTILSSLGGGVSTYVQPGTNITTGGTASTPIVSLDDNISIVSIHSSTIPTNKVLYADASGYFTGSTEFGYSAATQYGQVPNWKVGSNFYYPKTTGGFLYVSAANGLISAGGNFNGVTITAISLSAQSSVYTNDLVVSSWQQYCIPYVEYSTGNVDTDSKLKWLSTSSVLAVNGGISGNTVTGGTIYSGANEISTLFAPKLIPLRSDSTDRILSATDSGAFIAMSGAGTQNIVVPSNSAVPLSNGFQVVIQQTGAGSVHFSADTGVTIQSYSGATTLAGQYAGASLTKTGSNTWALIGNVT